MLMFGDVLWLLCVSDDVDVCVVECVFGGVLR